MPGSPASGRTAATARRADSSAASRSAVDRALAGAVGVASGGRRGRGGLGPRAQLGPGRDDVGAVEHWWRQRCDRVARVAERVAGRGGPGGDGVAPAHGVAVVGLGPAELLLGPVPGLAQRDRVVDRRRDGRRRRQPADRGAGGLEQADVFGDGRRPLLRRPLVLGGAREHGHRRRVGAGGVEYAVSARAASARAAAARARSAGRLVAGGEQLSHRRRAGQRLAELVGGPPEGGGLGAGGVGLTAGRRRRRPRRRGGCQRPVEGVLALGQLGRSVIRGERTHRLLAHGAVVADPQGGDEPRRPGPQAGVVESAALVVGIGLGMRRGALRRLGASLGGGHGVPERGEAGLGLGQAARAGRASARRRPRRAPRPRRRRRPVRPRPPPVPLRRACRAAR